MKTVAQVLAGAYRKNARVTPNRLIADSTEGVEIVHDSLQALFLFAALLNPAAMGDTDAVAWSEVVDGWIWPDDVSRVYWRETIDGDEVVLVPMRNRDIEQEKPTVISWGRVYKPAGNPNDLTESDDLVLYYAPKPTLQSDIDGEIDARWLEQFDFLLELEVAVRFNMKSSMPDALQVIKAERDAAARVFVQFLREFEGAQVSEFDTDRQFTDSALQNAAQLLAGGAQLTT